MRRFCIATSAAILFAACANIEELPSLVEKPPALLAPPEPLVEAPRPAEGALWRGDQSRRFLAFENRAKRIGDLVSVIILEEASAENEAKTELDHSSAFDATLNSDVALQTLVTRPIRRILGLLGFTDQKNDADPSTELSIIESSAETSYDGEGKLERSASFTTKIACVVTDQTESGLLHIQGERHLTINGETQIIQLSGFVRPEDIRIDNTLPSELIAAADIRYGGVGLVSEQQRMPWLSRLLRLALPF
ncbi:MAG: flagellar basal body L-ring protein FlgH [bacterium]|nr:flagellar basal body L-ring protein FlgH [bacterium]